MAKKIQAELEKLVNKELHLANEKHPQFNSTHEGYAVLMEEVEEAQDALTLVLNGLGALWQDVRQNKDTPTDALQDMQKTAMHLAYEAVQVAAMMKKYTRFVESDKWAEK